MNNLKINERRVNDVLILDITGKLRLGEGSAEFHTAIRLLAQAGEKKIIVNLAEVSYIDSSGLGELVAGYTALKRNEGELKLLHLTKRVHELMFMTKLLTVFDNYESESEALKSFENSASETERSESSLAKEAAL